MKKIVIFLSLLLSLNSYSQADTTTNTTKATAQLAAKCEVSTVDVNLGEMVPGKPSSSGTGNFIAKCTRSTSFKYYIGIRQWGSDCAYLQGTTKSDKVLYNIKDLQTNAITGNNYSGTGTSQGGILTSVVATGSNQPLSFLFEVQPSWSNMAGCPTGLKYPGTGYNPFITPDNYTDTLVFGVIY